MTGRAVLAAMLMLSASGLAIAACGASHDRSNKESSMAQPDPLAEMRSDILTVVGGLGEDAFVVVDDYATVPGNVYFKTIQWAKEVFREGQGPFDAPGPVVHSYHIARPDRLDFDLVRHSYAAAGCRVDVIEGAAFYYVRAKGFDPRSFGGGDPAKQAAGLAAALLKIASPVFVSLPADGAAASPAMSTAPDRNLTQIGSWPDRIDAVRTADGMAIICYKRDLRLQEIIDFNRWFPDDFRTGRR
jgi:hypothetical protein